VKKKTSLTNDAPRFFCCGARVVSFGLVPYRKVRYCCGAAQCGTVSGGAAQCGTVSGGGAQCGTVSGGGWRLALCVFPLAGGPDVHELFKLDELYGGDLVRRIGANNGAVQLT